MALTCPVCREGLTPGPQVFRCARGHSFDRAKEGYVSLLHGRQKGDGRGDSKEMILARDRVHRAGVFDPLVSALTTLSFAQAPRALLELGCGEGFFLGHLTRAQGSAASYGLDLSVDAVKLAARRLPTSLFVRADLLQPLPFADASLDLVASIFAPRPLAEIRRVLRPGGSALFVYPEVDHWHELRAFLPLAKIGEEKLPAGGLQGFTLACDEPVKAHRALNHATLVDLVAMSPSIHRLMREGASWQEQLPQQLTATLSVRVTVFRKE